jgi:hypothetical protein
MIYEIYCDESRQTSEHFMVIGGIIIRQENAEAVNEILADYRIDFGMIKELKWGRVSKRFIEQYKKFIDIFFELIESNKIIFHCIIMDTKKFRQLQKGKDKEVGFYTVYYYLLLHRFGRRYHSEKHNCRFHLKLDQRNSTFPLDRLNKYLNNALIGYGVRYRPFRSIEPIDSKHHDLLQMVDILIGAIGYEKNQLNVKVGASPAKTELIMHLTKKSGFKNLITNTPKRDERFGIWNFQV